MGNPVLANDLQIFGRELFGVRNNNKNNFL